MGVNKADSLFVVSCVTFGIRGDEGEVVKGDAVASPASQPTTAHQRREEYDRRR